MDKRLTVVIPTYNEAANLPQLAAALLALSIRGTELSVLVVDDASPDGTGRLAEELAGRQPDRFHVLHRASKKGLASACIEGFARALETGADLVAQMDADLSHDPNILPLMVGRIENADVVIGSRYIANGSVDPEWSRHRKFLSKLANRSFVPLLLGLETHDSTSGYRLWRRETLLAINPALNVSSNGYAFQVEMLYLTERLDCRIVEIPIHFPERRAGTSKMNLPVKLSAIYDILTMPWRHLQNGASAGTSEGGPGAISK